MNPVQALEQERQAILDRTQMRRETYRRALHDGHDLRTLPARGDGNAFVTVRPARANGATVDTTTYQYRHVPDSFPRSRLAQTMRDHPMLWALGVAAVLAIGPRRIARSVSSGSMALGAVAASRSRMDMIGRVLTLAGSIVQRRGN